MKSSTTMNFLKRYGIAVVLGAAALSAMGSGCGGSGQTLRSPMVETPTVGGKAADASGAPGADGKTAVDAGAQKIAAANRAFGLALLQKLSKDGGTDNVLVSPYSIAQALSMTYTGADGETQKEMSKVLGYDKLKPAEVDAGNASLRTAFKDVDPKVTIHVANALWSKTGLSFADDFAKRAEQGYGAKTGSLDFGSESAVQAINAWVKENTSGKIETLFSREDLTAQTSAVLANAIYFKGLWKEPFEKSATRDASFKLAGGKTVTVPMMSRTDTYPVLRKEGLQAVALPYGAGRLRLYVFLPESGLDKFVAGITSEKWTAWTSEFQDSKIALSLPRFKMGYSAALNEPLQAMGMKSAFGSGADFKNMGVGDFSIAKVQHKAVMEVNEEGTEAAAATGVVGVTSLPPEVRVDRPFLCAIADTTTGALLFVGTVYDPTKEG